MVGDSISDMLARIKNGYMAKKATVILPWSRAKEAVIKVLADNGYVMAYQVKGSEPKRVLEVKLKYDGKQPAVVDVRRVSRPSLRVYAGKNNLPRVLGGLGLAIISTPMGMMTDKEARKQKVGGEIIAEVW